MIHPAPTLTLVLLALIAACEPTSTPQQASQGSSRREERREEVGANTEDGSRGDTGESVVFRSTMATPWSATNLSGLLVPREGSNGSAYNADSCETIQVACVLGK